MKGQATRAVIKNTTALAHPSGVLASSRAEVSLLGGFEGRQQGWLT